MIIKGYVMKLGIMQPYFFPYIGYFSLIKYVDRFVFFDTPQYISHGWVNRNRILKQDGTTNYIVVPIKKTSHLTPINMVCVNNDIKWQDKICGQLSVYKRKAPYYNYVLEVVKNIIHQPSDKLSELNIYGIQEICKELCISTPFDTFSQMELEIGTVAAPDEWALNITRAMGYDVYVNPPGGMSFFSREKYLDAGIKLEFLEAELVPYIQKIGHFEAGLSIVDIMMFCSVSEIKDMLNQYEIL